MPIMSPEIQELMWKAGLVEGKAQEKTESESISAKLERAGLGLDDALLNLANVANGSSNEGLRVKANETALKLHGVLKNDTAPPAVSNFTIVINDSKSEQKVSGVNPILLPRQLISKLEQQPEDKVTN